MVRNNSTCGLVDRNISDFHQKQQVTTSPGTLPYGKFGEDGGRLQSVERSTRFVWQTHWRTDTQTNFIICPMLLMHWADNKKTWQLRMHRNLRPPDTASVLIRFNYDAHAKFEVAQPINCRLIALLLLTPYPTLWPWPLALNTGSVWPVTQ